MGYSGIVLLTGINDFTNDVRELLLDSCNEERLIVENYVPVYNKSRSLMISCGYEGFHEVSIDDLLTNVLRRAALRAFHDEKISYNLAGDFVKLENGSGVSEELINGAEPLYQVLAKFKSPQMASNIFEKFYLSNF